MAEVLSVEAVLEDGRLVRGAGAARQLRAAPPSHVQCRGEGAAQLHARLLLKEHAAMKTEDRAVLRIRDVYLGSNFFHPGSQIHIKEFRYFNPKKWFLRSRKYNPGCSSQIPDPDPAFLPIPDPKVKKVRYRISDTGSATLIQIRIHRRKNPYLVTP